MPRKHPPYSTVETVSCGLTDAQIELHIADVQSQSPGVVFTDGAAPDAICRALNVDVEYSCLPNEILLDVAIGKRPVIWLPKRSKPRQDRMLVATALGFWLIHVPLCRESAPGCGIQALYRPTDPEAMREAARFGQALLMPAALFKSLWYEGRAQLVADTLNVPTQSVYDRAKSLMLTDESVDPYDSDPVLPPENEITDANTPETQNGRPDDPGKPADALA